VVVLKGLVSVRRYLLICGGPGALPEHVSRWRVWERRSNRIAGGHQGDDASSRLRVPRLAYGYGFLIIDYERETIVTHGGGRRGASSHLLLVPQRGVSIAALANLEGATLWSATHGALHLLLGLPVDWRPIPLTPLTHWQRGV
jgi:hypothetical protein